MAYQETKGQKEARARMLASLEEQRRYMQQEQQKVEAEQARWDNTIGDEMARGASMGASLGAFGGPAGAGYGALAGAGLGAIASGKPWDIVNPTKWGGIIKGAGETVLNDPKLALGPGMAVGKSMARDRLLNQMSQMNSPVGSIVPQGQQLGLQGEAPQDFKFTQPEFPLNELQTSNQFGASSMEGMSMPKFKPRY
jgi:hypothetical protein